jgi:hypothetical protein
MFNVIRLIENSYSLENLRYFVYEPEALRPEVHQMLISSETQFPIKHFELFQKSRNVAIGIAQACHMA